MSGSNTVIISYGDVIEQMGDWMVDSVGFDEEMDMSEFMGTLKETFAGISGVSNTKVINEVEKKIMGFSFDFKDKNSRSLG